MGVTNDAKSAAGKAAQGTKAAAAKMAGATGAVAVGYWRGLRYPFKGLKFVYWKHPGLVRFWIFPILITGLLLASTTWLGWSTYETITNAIWDDPIASVEQHKAWPSADSGKTKPVRTKRLADADGPSWTQTAGHWAHSALAYLVLALIWALGVVSAILLTNVVAAPFNDLLSEEVERLRTGRKGPPFSLALVLRDGMRTVGLEMMKLTFYLAVMGPLFILSNVLPVVGPVIYSVFGFIFTAMYFAIDYIDWPASRRNRSMNYRFSMLKQHAMPMFGFGSGVWLFLFIPLVNLFFMPAAVAGGTLLFLDLEDGAVGAAGG